MGKKVAEESSVHKDVPHVGDAYPSDGRVLG